MALFGKKKQQDNMVKDMQSQVENTTIQVKVLGSGCTKCWELEQEACSALKELGINSKIEHITDFVEIAAYGVMRTPALVVNNQVVSCGQVLKKDDIKILIQKVRG